MCPITICLLVYRLKQLRCSTCRREESTSMPGTSKGSVESQWCGGWVQEGPGHQKFPHWPSVTFCSDTEPSSRVGGVVTLFNCQEGK